MLNISNRFFKFKHISIIFILFTSIFFVLVYYFISSSKEEIISKDIKINPQELYLQNSNKIFLKLTIILRKIKYCKLYFTH